MKLGVGTFIGDVLFDALMHAGARLHDWFFTEERAVRWREKLRDRWWRYKTRAEGTQSKRDDRRAKCWQLLMDYNTPPKL